jgi:hypothetical protein
MHSLMKFFFTSVLLSQVWINTSTAAQLVFFQSFNAKGEPVIFEGLYSHAAISFQGQWLHAHPYFGIELTSDLTRFGPHYKIIENPDYPEPSPEFVEVQLKKKFNIFADWHSPDETYCSKLVGKALNMTPTKMRFQSKNWRATRAANYRGQLGLSPSDVYWYARRQLRFRTAEEIPSALMQRPRSCLSFLQN